MINDNFEQLNNIRFARSLKNTIIIPHRVVLPHSQGNRSARNKKDCFMSVALRANPAPQLGLASLFTTAN
jgi:hypothetical protein